MLQTLESHWDWKTSNRFRAASLASAWLLVLLSNVLGPLFVPAFLARTVLSALQSALNIRLGHRVAIAGPTRSDWFLVVSIFLAAEMLSFARAYGPGLADWQLFCPLMLPFTLLQLRIFARARTAHACATAERHGLIRLERRLHREAA